MDARQADLLRDLDPAVLGQRIRAARLAGGLTQGQLAGADVTIGYVSRIEAGQRRPDAKVLERMASRLKMSLDHLLLGVSPRESDEVRLTLDYAELSLESGETDEAARRTAEVLENLAVESMAELHARALYLHARALEGQGQLDEAILDLELLVGRGASDPHWLPASIALSRCYREAGDFTRAVEAGEIVLTKLSDEGLDGSDEAVQLAVTIAAAYFERGDSGYAVRLCRKAIGRADSSGSPVARASAYWNASMMESQRGSIAAAIAMAERALALLGEGRDARNLARLRLQLGTMQLQLDPPEVKDAVRNLERARRELVSSSATAIDIARCDVATARARFLSGDVTGARRLAARTHAATLGTVPLLAADARALEGQAAAAEGDWAHAKTAYRDAVLLLSSAGADRGAGQLWFELGALLEEAGDAEAARDAYRSAAVSTGLRTRTSARARV